MIASNARVGLLAMAAAVVSFGLSTPTVKWADEPGVVVAFWRMWIAAAAWWIVLSAMRLPKPDRRTWKLVAPAGLLFGLNISVLFTALTRTSIAHAEFIATLAPLLVVPAGAVVFHERPRWSALRFGVISLVGVAMVLFYGPTTGTATVGGDLLMFVVLCTWTGYLVFTKRARASGVDTTTFMACMTPIGLITTVPMAMLLADDEVFSMSARGWGVALGLAVLTGMVAHGCIALAQQYLPIATITIMQMAQPALAVCFAYLILDEAVHQLQIVGMVLVLTGITAFTLTSQRPVPPPTVTTAAGTRS